jgi:hypothetical protein
MPIYSLRSGVSVSTVPKAKELRMITKVGGITLGSKNSCLEKVSNLQ